VIETQVHFDHRQQDRRRSRIKEFPLSPDVEPDGLFLAWLTVK
jgi:hypothetical protein